MNNRYKIVFLLPILILLIFSSFYFKDFRIDASSDSLVAQNDTDFQYFLYYQDLFPTKNSLVIAIKSNSEIDDLLLNEVKNLSNKLSDLPEVYSVFNINKAPILLLNNTSLLDLSNNNYETILETNFEIEKVLNEFTNSPIYSDQIINKDKNITALVIFLNKNEKAIDLKKNKKLYQSKGIYYKIKTELDNEKKQLIQKI